MDWCDFEMTTYTVLGPDPIFEKDQDPDADIIYLWDKISRTWFFVAINFT